MTALLAAALATERARHFTLQPTYTRCRPCRPSAGKVSEDLPPRTAYRKQVRRCACRRPDWSVDETLSLQVIPPSGAHKRQAVLA